MRRLTRMLGLVALLPVAARAADLPPQAQAAFVEAQALQRAGLKDDAAAALDRAIAAAPQWPAPRVMRARLLEAAVLNDASASAAGTFDESFDYDGALRKLAALADDLTTVAAPESGAPTDDVAWAARLADSVRAREAALRNQHTTVRAQVMAQRAAEEAERKAREEAARRAEAERVARAEYDSRTLGYRVRKGVGIGAVAVGGASAVAAAIAFGASVGHVDDVRQGSVASAGAVPSKLEDAGSLRSASLGLAVAAAALTAGGLSLWLTASEPPPFDFVGVGPLKGGGLLSVSGSF